MFQDSVMSCVSRGSLFSEPMSDRHLKLLLIRLRKRLCAAVKFQDAVVCLLRRTYYKNYNSKNYDWGEILSKFRILY